MRGHAMGIIFLRFAGGLAIIIISLLLLLSCKFYSRKNKKVLLWKSISLGPQS